MNNLRRATVGVAALVGLNLALGYVRDVGIAARFGSSDVTDAFFAGTFLPLLVQQIALVGSLVPAFLPALTAEARRGANAQPWRLTALVAGLVTAAAGGVVLIGWIGAEPLVRVFAAGFPPAKVALAADLFRLSLPMLLGLGPATVVGAVLNYHGRFLAPAAAAAAFNGTVALALFLFSPALGIHSAAIGMGLGGLVQLLVQLPALWAVWRARTPDAHGEPLRAYAVSAFRTPQSALRLTGRLAAPLLATVAVAQVVAVAQGALASHLADGALSVLNYAMKLNLLPTVIFAGAVTTVLFPTLSRQALEMGAGDGRAYAASLRQGLGQVVFWTAPAAAWLIVCAEPLVRVVYERQRFSPADSVATGRVLALYAVGLVPLALNVMLPRAYYARQDMRTPLLATLAGTILYLGLAIPGAGLAGAGGLALALSLANVVQMGLLAAGLRTALADEWSALLRRAARAGLAALGMGVLCLGLRSGADAAGLLSGPFLLQAATVGVLALSGAGLFWLLDFGLALLGRARRQYRVPRPSVLLPHSAYLDDGATRTTPRD